MVPFKGGAESFQALIGRHLDVYGDPGFGPQAPVGLVAPRGLDPKIAARLQGAFMKAAGDAEYLKQLDNFDMQASVMSGEAYLGYARGQFERERRMLGESGFRAE